MVAQFSIPVLSVAADAVRDLEGRDALHGLWTLFTKCKESLQDGRRLENISWRLWYREMMLLNQERETGYSVNDNLSSENEKLVDELTVDEKSVYQPVTPSHSVSILPAFSPVSNGAPQLTFQYQPDSASSVLSSPLHSPLLVPPSPAFSSSISEHSRRPSLSRSRRSSFLNGSAGTPVCVGKIIYDMLPSSSASTSSASLASSSILHSTSASKGGTSALFLPGPVLSRRPSSASDGPSVRPTKCSMPETSSSLILQPHDRVLSLPTPDSEEAEPQHLIISANNKYPLTSASSTSPSNTKPLSSSNPSIPSPSIPATLIAAPTIATPFSLSNYFTDSTDNSTHVNSAASAPLSPPPVLQAPVFYTGPPSPSLSDSYMRAHPGEVEVQELGLMSSLSSTNPTMTNEFLGAPQHQSHLESQPLTDTQMSLSTSSVPLVQTPPPQQPPQLVVVNPTPNPTPHPTPPATPLMHGTIGPGGMIRSHWLMLPEGAPGGARQQQLLQAAQRQIQQMQAALPQLSALRLPPPAGLAGGGINARVNPGQGDRSTVAEEESAFVSDLSHANHLASDPMQPPIEGEGYTESNGEREASDMHPSQKGHCHSMSSPTSSSHSHNSDRSSESWKAESTTTNTTLPSEGGLDAHPCYIASHIEPLSTVLSMSLLTDGRNEGSLEDTPDVADTAAVADIEEEDAAPLSPLPPPGGLSMSPRSDKWRKRNSASTLGSPSNLSPTPSGSGHPSDTLTSSPKSSSAHGKHAKRRTVTAGGALNRRASSVRSASASRSRSTGGSSVGKSRSRSREPGAVGIGGLSMTTVASPPQPPPAPPAVVRKVAGARGRAKVVLGRAGIKGKGPLRRNSSGLGMGTAAAAEAEALEQELRREQLEREDQEQMALEIERQRYMEQEQEREAREARLKAEEERRQEERHRTQLGSLAAVDVGSSKRPARFNIGSNSDEGSGMGSKSAGSGSDGSGGHIRGGKGEDRHAVPLSKAKGKARQRDADQRDMAQQLRHQLQQHQQQQQQQRDLQQDQDHQLKDKLNLQPQFQRQMSKSQLHQLQKMQQLYQQHQNQHQPQHQHPQPFQHHPQPLRVGETQNGKEKEVIAAPKPTKSTSKVNVALDDDLAAKVKQSLAAPLLPQNRRTIVLATSESESETDSEDEGSWSSEVMTGDEVGEKRAREVELQQQELKRQQQILLQRQQQQNQLQQQQPQPPARPPAVQRTQSSHYPAPNNARGSKQISRAQQQQHRQAQINAQALVEKAALEAKRQREMFVKLPSASFQNLANARTRSVGLLTQLMNPNPEIFPTNHPYRRGFSSGEIRPGGISTASQSRPLPAPAIPERPAAVRNAPANEVANGHAECSPQHHPDHRRRNSDDRGDKKSGTGPGPSRANFSPPSRPAGLQRTKSAVAMPLSSQIMAGSVSTKAPPKIDLASAMLTHMQPSDTLSGGYRPRGPPKDQELEEDSGSEAEGGIQFSKSVAQEKLKALAQRSRITPNARRSPDLDGPQPPKVTAGLPTHGDDNDVPQWARVSQPPPKTHSQGQPQNRRLLNGGQFTQVEQPKPPGPIPLGYPYNLPPPALPSTPRTTRRQMLSTELPESLRRNLLWERKVSNNNVNLTGVKRSASGGGTRHSILGGLQPLTAAPSMVQLHAKGTGPPGSSNDEDVRELRKNDSAAEQQRRKAMARNKSWANDYHYSGW